MASLASTAQLPALSTHERDETGGELIRVVSMRALARRERWGRVDLFAAERSVCRGVRAITGEVDVEAYLGSFDRGWSSA